MALDVNFYSSTKNFISKIQQPHKTLWLIEKKTFYDPFLFNIGYLIFVQFGLILPTLSAFLNKSWITFVSSQLQKVAIFSSTTCQKIRYGFTQKKLVYSFKIFYATF